VHLGVGRDVDVDHRLELGDVEPARGDVGGHQHAAAAVGELHQHLVAVALFQVAVQFQRHEALRLQQRDARSRHCCLVLQKASVLTGRKWRSSRRHRVQALVLLHLVEALADLAGGVRARSA
jgi:hypothetical protein